MDDIMEGLLEYNIAPGKVEAFTTFRDSELPYFVVTGHQVHGTKPENLKAVIGPGLCTYEDGRFFSARREGTACGRNINAIKLL